MRVRRYFDRLVSVLLVRMRVSGRVPVVHERMMMVMIAVMTTVGIVMIRIGAREIGRKMGVGVVVPTVLVNNERQRRRGGHPNEIEGNCANPATLSD